MHDLSKVKIAIIGLGYVGLPLAVEFGKKYKVLGFDINQDRIDELNLGKDSTLEVAPEDLQGLKDLQFSSSKNDLKDCNVYVVTVPTPIDNYMQPDLTSLIQASEMIGKVINKGDVIIYESTVYPGATEEECIPVVENSSGLNFNHDFYAGYSPERINPGDKEHRVANILKVTSGSTPQIAFFIDELYASIITAGTHLASSIKVAEAAKVIENTQRDVNIALINELSLIFNRLDIDTLEVLEAAGTKWNFLPFRPGLVGGHCIGVDPYYLTYKAQAVGYHPEMILAGRRLNDNMSKNVVARLVKEMVVRGINVGAARILVMGLTFKENCPDLRNTKAVDIIHELTSYGTEVDILDPWCSAEEAIKEYGFIVHKNVSEDSYDGIIIVVSHDEFKAMGAQKIRALGKKNHVLYDLKYVLEKDSSDIRL